MPDNSNFELPRDPNQGFSYRRYEEPFSSVNLAFNATLQEFSYRIRQIAIARSQGSITHEQAYGLIDQLWDELNRSKQGLGIES